MTNTYVIGDVQGCYEELNHLLDKIKYEQGDNLWFVGDMINRGPDNVGVMDLILSLDNVTCVLGNHDLHFLAIARGVQTPKRSDTVQDLLASKHLPDYIEYLRQLPLLHYAADSHRLMVHAGLPPQLELPQCLEMAAEVESVLQSEECDEFLSAMYGNEPATWNDSLGGMARLRVITNYFTRIRYCRKDGELELTHKADKAPDGFDPWFSFERNDGLLILFGHWAALNGVSGVPNALALDTGCVWGRELTALRLEDMQYFSVEAKR